MAFIEIFWATYAPYNLLIAHLKAGLPGLVYSVRPGWFRGRLSPHWRAGSFWRACAARSQGTQATARKLHFAQPNKSGGEHL